jgi:predicted secreted protein
LRQATDTALAEVKKAVQPGSMEVRTGSFSLQPRYSNEGRISGWVGSTELILEGNDFVRISGAAARVQPMTINNLSFGLSRPVRAQLETQAQAMAIGNFKTKALEVARGFGFSDYVLREVSINAADQYPGPRPGLAAMSFRAKASDVAPVALESGKSLVVVTVSGAVQLK